VTAACVTIQQQVDRTFLWSACPHHIGEVILLHVFDDMKIDTSKSSEFMVVTRFSKQIQLLGSHRSASPHSCSEGS